MFSFRLKYGMTLCKSIPHETENSSTRLVQGMWMSLVSYRCIKVGKMQFNDSNHHVHRQNRSAIILQMMGDVIEPLLAFPNLLPVSHIPRSKATGITAASLSNIEETMRKLDEHLAFLVNIKKGKETKSCGEHKDGTNDCEQCIRQRGELIHMFDEEDRKKQRAFVRADTSSVIQKLHAESNARKLQDYTAGSSQWQQPQYMLPKSSYTNRGSGIEPFPLPGSHYSALPMLSRSPGSLPSISPRTPDASPSTYRFDQQPCWNGGISTGSYRNDRTRPDSVSSRNLGYFHLGQRGSYYPTYEQGYRQPNRALPPNRAPQTAMANAAKGDAYNDRYFTSPGTAYGTTGPQHYHVPRDGLTWPGILNAASVANSQADYGFYGPPHNPSGDIDKFTLRDTLDVSGPPMHPRYQTYAPEASGRGDSRLSGSGYAHSSDSGDHLELSKPVPDRQTHNPLTNPSGNFRFSSSNFSGNNEFSMFNHTDARDGIPSQHYSGEASDLVGNVDFTLHHESSSAAMHHNTGVFRYSPHQYLQNHESDGDFSSDHQASATTTTHLDEHKDVLDEMKRSQITDDQEMPRKRQRIKEIGDVDANAVEPDP